MYVIFFISSIEVNTTEVNVNLTLSMKIGPKRSYVRGTVRRELIRKSFEYSNIQMNVCMYVMQKPPLLRDDLPKELAYIIHMTPA